jgi:hypothetical protein
LTETGDIPTLGTVLDGRQRDRLLRIDNEARRLLVNNVRQWLFEDGDSNGSKRITINLGKTSVTTTQVCESTNGIMFPN